MATIVLYRLHGKRETDGPRWQFWRPHYDVYPAAWATGHLAEMSRVSLTAEGLVDGDGNAWSIADALATAQLSLTDPWES